MIFVLVLNGSTQVRLIDLRSCVVYENAICVHSNAFGPSFLNYWGCGMITERCSSKAKCTIGLKLEHRLVLRAAFRHLYLWHLGGCDDVM